jgi:hypothetical protein
MTPSIAIRLLACTTLFSQMMLAQLRWEVMPTPTAPAPRFGHAMAGYGFLFGGRDQGQVFADAWSYEPWGWRAVTAATAPPARHGHALAHRTYFTTQLISEYLMFGGEDLAGTMLGGTWLFTGSHQPVPGGYPVFTGSWQQLPLAVAPSPRSGHAMSYDYWTSSECLLFGGAVSTGLSDETWRFTNGAWQLVQTVVRPPARRGHRLLAASGGFVLCGGTDGTTPFNDCWLFDGTGWQQQAAVPFAGHDTLASWSDRGRHAVVSSMVAGGAVLTSLHERPTDGSWLPQEQSGVAVARTGAATWDWLQPAVLMLFGGRDGQGTVLGDTLRLVPEHVVASTLIGSGCGPGAWSSTNGPDLFLPRLLLGSTGTIRLYTASPHTLTLLGLQLGAAPAPAACQITVVPELLIATVTNAQLLAEVPLHAPFATSLRGLEVSMQALAFEPLAASGFAISRVGILTLGD